MLLASSPERAWWLGLPEKNGIRSRTSTIGTEGWRTATTRSPDGSIRSCVRTGFGLTGLANAGTASRALIGRPALRASAHRWYSLRSSPVPRCNARSSGRSRDQLERGTLVGHQPAGGAPDIGVGYPGQQL